MCDYKVIETLYVSLVVMVSP